MNTREEGSKREQAAKDYLCRQGMTIVEMNYRTRQGEIDLIGYDEDCLVFVEVKYRKNERMGSAAEAVGIQKQQRICNAADFYRYSHHIGQNVNVRYDVVAIQGEKVQWIKNAFPHIGRYL